MHAKRSARRSVSLGELDLKPGAAQALAVRHYPHASNCPDEDFLSSSMVCIPAVSHVSGHRGPMRSEVDALCGVDERRCEVRAAASFGSSHGIVSHTRR